jgi:outer membrane biosynthesis protein TonB
MTEHPFVGLAAAGALSLLAHGFAYASLGLAPAPAPEPAPTRVTFRVRDATPAPPTPPPVPKLAEAPKPDPHVLRAKPKSAPSVNPEPAITPPPVDLRGVTLTNETGTSAWSSAVGNGSAFDGPVGPVGPAAAHLAAPGSAAPAAARASEVPVVAVADLSSRPVPPELGPDLRAHYPADAKLRGIGGSATVDARIEPDGRVRLVAIQNESFTGFGDACKMTLLGSRWSPPRDKQGHAVATRVRYTCRFVVEH